METQRLTHRERETKEICEICRELLAFLQGYLFFPRVQCKHVVRGRKYEVNAVTDTGANIDGTESEKQGK